jgi:hypothetical protein
MRLKSFSVFLGVFLLTIADVKAQGIVPTLDFNSYFVDRENWRIKNMDKFQNRISGLVSYYGHFYNTKTNSTGPYHRPHKS